LGGTLHSIWKTLIIVQLVLTAYSATIGPPFAATAVDYHLLARLTLGGERFWDYLAIDTQARRGLHLPLVALDGHERITRRHFVQTVVASTAAVETGHSFRNSAFGQPQPERAALVYSGGSCGAARSSLRIT
jgi:hypothetical protein